MAKETTGAEHEISKHIMAFLNEQAEVVRKARGGQDEAGLLDAERDHAYAQLTRRELGNTEKALRKILLNDAGPRRLAALLSVAIKHADKVL